MEQDSVLVASEETLYEDPEEREDDIVVNAFDLTSTPNDFNVATIHNYIERGTLVIPDFQRNYVWDLKRASRLIESLLLGLPIPQLFLYEEQRNKFLVIDGQQRLLSIYFFKKMRFPRMDRRGALRKIYDQHGSLSNEVLHDDAYFHPFNLALPSRAPSRPSRYSGLNYETLVSEQETLDLRPIRNVVVKQNVATADRAPIFEIFNRLNTGGVNLTPQEIRASLFHSSFYERVRHMNLDSRWRRFLFSSEPDLHLKDLELILRGFAMLEKGERYSPSMVQFLNGYSDDATKFDAQHVQYLEGLFHSFLASASGLRDDAFKNKGNRRFNVALYEAVFFAASRDAYGSRSLITQKLLASSVAELESDDGFQQAAVKASADSANVKTRRERAVTIVKFE